MTHDNDKGDKGLALPSVSPVPASIPSADEFGRMIRRTLAEHPLWLPEAISALTHGTQLALEKLNRQRAASDFACLAALALCDTKRLSPDARAGLLATITKAMNPPNLCQLEEKFAAQAIQARRAETGTGSVEDESPPCAQGLTA